VSARFLNLLEGELKDDHVGAATARRKGIEVGQRLDSRNLEDMLTFFKSNAARAARRGSWDSVCG
jgi:hypothetical protein